MSARLPARLLLAAVTATAATTLASCSEDAADLGEAMDAVCDTPVEDEAELEDGGHSDPGSVTDGRTELRGCELDQGNLVFGARYDSDPRDALEEIWQLGLEADGDSLFWALSEQDDGYVVVYYTGADSEGGGLDALEDEGYEVNASMEEF